MSIEKDYFHSKEWEEAQNKIIQNLLLEIDLYKSSIFKAENIFGKDGEVSEFVNAMPFVRLSFMDITILFRDCNNAKSDWELKLYSRLLCLCIYEFLESVGKLFSNKYRKKLSSWPDSETLVQDLKELTKHYNNLKEEIKDYVKEIRNNTIAHRDKDAIKQILLIDSLDVHKIKYATIEIHNWYSKYRDFEEKMMLQTKPFYKGELDT